MPETKPTKTPATVDEYIAALPDQARARLTELREALNAAAPGGEESISYGMPTLKYQKARVYFAAWKSHYAMYGIVSAALAPHREQMKGYVKEKGTIQFPYSEPLPVALVTSLVKAQIADYEKDEK